MNMRKILILNTFFASAISVFATDFTVTASGGNFSSPSTWGLESGVPSSTSDAIILNGSGKLTIDTDCTTGALKVNGTNSGVEIDSGKKWTMKEVACDGYDTTISGGGTIYVTAYEQFSTGKVWTKNNVTISSNFSGKGVNINGHSTLVFNSTNELGLISYCDGAKSIYDFTVNNSSNRNGHVEIKGTANIAGIAVTANAKLIIDTNSLNVRTSDFTIGGNSYKIATNGSATGNASVTGGTLELVGAEGRNSYDFNEISLANDSTLILANKNAYAGAVIATGNNTIQVNQTTLSILEVSDGIVSVALSDIDASNKAFLKLDDVIISGDTSKITITGVANESLWFGSDYITASDWDEDATKIYVNGSENSLADELANGIWFLNQATNGFYLSTTAVPEPAQWAVIFGAIALGFVAYRRRR